MFRPESPAGPVNWENIMKYRAMRDGYIGGHYVRAGETFTYNGKKPSWAESLAPEKAKGGAPSESAKGGAPSESEAEKK